jgi:hypothetical protein
VQQNIWRQQQEQQQQQQQWHEATLLAGERDCQQCVLPCWLALRSCSVDVQGPGSAHMSASVVHANEGLLQSIKLWTVHPVDSWHALTTLNGGSCSRAALEEICDITVEFAALKCTRLAISIDNCSTCFVQQQWLASWS